MPRARDDVDIYAVLKAQQWERAKGELRAHVAMVGSCPSTDEAGGKQHDRLVIRVEAFIKTVEDDGLQE